MREFTEQPKLVDPRYETVTIRVNDTELQVLERYARAAGETRPQFVRRAIGNLIAASPKAG
jgi:uncharacterized protein (DUF1778 family)